MVRFLKKSLSKKGIEFFYRIMLHIFYSFWAVKIIYENPLFGLVTARDTGGNMCDLSDA
jgi:hypothetical protein